MYAQIKAVKVMLLIGLVPQMNFPQIPIHGASLVSLETAEMALGKGFHQSVTTELSFLCGLVHEQV